MSTNENTISAAVLDHAVHAYKVACVARMAMETDPDGTPSIAVIDASIREGVRAALAAGGRPVARAGVTDPLPIVAAPRDGTMLRLLVRFTDHATDDAEEAWTIGSNSFDANGEDVWQFAGWCWTHDHFTEGKGTPIGWLPMLALQLAAPVGVPAKAEQVGERANPPASCASDWVIVENGFRVLVDQLEARGWNRCRKAFLAAPSAPQGPQS